MNTNIHLGCTTGRPGPALDVERLAATAAAQLGPGWLPMSIPGGTWALVHGRSPRHWITLAPVPSGSVRTSHAPNAEPADASYVQVTVEGPLEDTDDTATGLLAVLGGADPEDAARDLVDLVAELNRRVVEEHQAATPYTFEERSETVAWLLGPDTQRSATRTDTQDRFTVNGVHLLLSENIPGRPTLFASACVSCGSCSDCRDCCIDVAVSYRHTDLDFSDAAMTCGQAALATHRAAVDLIRLLADAS